MCEVSVVSLWYVVGDVVHEVVLRCVHVACCVLRTKEMRQTAALPNKSLPKMN